MCFVKIWLFLLVWLTIFRPSWDFGSGFLKQIQEKKRHVADEVSGYTVDLGLWAELGNICCLFNLIAPFFFLLAILLWVWGLVHVVSRCFECYFCSTYVVRFVGPSSLFLLCSFNIFC